MTLNKITVVVCSFVFFLSNVSFGQSKARSSVFSEIMGPSFKTSSEAPATPLATGEANDPINAFNIFQLDHKITENVLAFYFQRTILMMNNTPTARQGFRFLDPRVGTRLINVIKAPRYSSTIDFYIQPGISKASADIGRQLDMGVQSNIKYAFSEWTVGSIVDVRKSFFTERGQGNDLSGSFAPYISRALGKRFSTQTWFSFPWRHTKGKEYTTQSFTWNSPGEPYVQNGIGFSATDQVWVALMLNNYILTAPKLENTWASLWLNFVVL